MQNEEIFCTSMNEVARPSNQTFFIKMSRISFDPNSFAE